MRIYMYAQHCVMAGRVVPTSKHDEYRAGEEDQSDDIFLYGDGTEDELIAQARAAIAATPKTSGPTFDWRCARNVLNYLGASMLEETDDADDE